jgi:hypothetical protein
VLRSAYIRSPLIRNTAQTFGVAPAAFFRWLVGIRRGWPGFRMETLACCPWNHNCCAWFVEEVETVTAGEVMRSNLVLVPTVRLRRPAAQLAR